MRRLEKSLFIRVLIPALENYHQLGRIIGSSDSFLKRPVAVKAAMRNFLLAIRPRIKAILEYIAAYYRPRGLSFF